MQWNVHMCQQLAHESGLAGWGRRAGAAAAPRNTFDEPQGSAGCVGQRQWLWHVGIVGKGASGVASAVVVRVDEERGREKENSVLGVEFGMRQKGLTPMPSRSARVMCSEVTL